MKLLLTFFTLILSVSATDRPNLLFILVDDLGRQDLGCYGSTFYETPHIDSLASQGMKFENAYVAHPRCVPSRFAIFSGNYPSRYGVPGFKMREFKHTLPLKIKTFGEFFQEAGYQTAYIGKWHLGDHGGEPKYQGFADSILAGHAGAPPSYFFPWDKARKGKSKENFPPAKGEQDEYRLTDEALAFIDRNKAKPFCLTLAHYAVHTPIEAPEELIKKYKTKLRKANSEIGGGREDKDLIKNSTGFYKSVQNHPGYAAMIESVDTGIGKILKKLQELKIADNTIIVLTSDHGGLSSRGLENKRELATSNLPYRHGKGWLYDGGIRVPLLVKWPGKVKAGSISKQKITGTDHSPTFLQMAGLKASPADHKDGKSYISALNGVDEDRGAIFWHSPAARPYSTGDTNMSAVINGDFKLIQCHDLKTAELYNLQKDPGEKNNLAEKNPEKLKELTDLLDGWKTAVNARLKTAKRKK